MEDPRPTLQHFFIMMEGTQPWGGCEDKHRDPGDLFGVTFQVRLVVDLFLVYLFVHSNMELVGNLEYSYLAIHRI